MGEVELRLACFDVRAAEPFDVRLIEHGGHRFDLAQRFFELSEQFLLEHAGVECRVVSGFREDVPRAEDQIFQLRKWYEIFD